MGKRKRKNYQSLDEIQAQLSVDRMAADPLVQEALDYIANEGGSDKYIDAAMADAMEYCHVDEQSYESCVFVKRMSYS